MEKKIKVAIVDDHGLMRQGIASMLENVPHISVVGILSGGEEAVNFARNHKPDLFLMDIVMRGMTGIEATRWIKEQDHEIKIILVSSEVSREYIGAGIKSGIDGYLPKDTEKTTLLKAIEQVMHGDRYFSPEVTSFVFQDFYEQEKKPGETRSKKRTELTKREEEVLTRIARGKSLKQIAEDLFISVKTVETHKLHIQDKLGLTNTAQLVKYAIENGLE